MTSIFSKSPHNNRKFQLKNNNRRHMELSAGSITILKLKDPTQSYSTKRNSVTFGNSSRSLENTKGQSGKLFHQPTFGRFPESDADISDSHQEVSERGFLSGKSGLEPEIGIKASDEEIISDEEESLAGAINNLDFEVNLGSGHERSRRCAPNAGTTVFRNLFEEYQASVGTEADVFSQDGGAGGRAAAKENKFIYKQKIGNQLRINNEGLADDLFTTPVRTQTQRIQENRGINGELKEQNEALQIDLILKRDVKHSLSPLEQDIHDFVTKLQIESQLVSPFSRKVQQFQCSPQPQKGGSAPECLSEVMLRLYSSPKACRKYSYGQQSTQFFESTIQLDRKAKNLIIMNNKRGTLRKSGASCALKEVVGVIQGGLSSRFWFLRKELDQKIQKGEVLPFYSWQCLTLQTADREIDLVIPDEKEYDDILVVLVHAMLYREQRARPSREVSTHPEDDSDQVCQQRLRRFKILRWRAKISFMAREQQKTIQELFLSAILKTCHALASLGQLPLSLADLYMQQDHTVDAILESSVAESLQLLATLNSNQELKDQQINYNLIPAPGKTFLAAASPALPPAPKGSQHQPTEERLLYQRKLGQRLESLRLVDSMTKQDSILQPSRSKRIQIQKLKQQKQTLDRKIVAFRSLKMIKGLLFLKLKLKQIELAKQLYEESSSQVIEIAFPLELRQSQFPLSFRFYDFYLNRVSSTVSNLKKHETKSQFLIKLKNCKQSGEQLQMMQLLENWTDENLDDLMMRSTKARRFKSPQIYTYKQKQDFKAKLLENGEFLLQNYNLKQKKKLVKEVKTINNDQVLDSNIQQTFDQFQSEKINESAEGMRSRMKLTFTQTQRTSLGSLRIPDELPVEARGPIRQGNLEQELLQYSEELGYSMRPERQMKIKDLGSSRPRPCSALQQPEVQKRCGDSDSDSLSAGDDSDHHEEPILSIGCIGLDSPSTSRSQQSLLSFKKSPAQADTLTNRIGQYEEAMHHLSANILDQSNKKAMAVLPSSSVALISKYEKHRSSASVACPSQEYILGTTEQADYSQN